MICVVASRVVPGECTAADCARRAHCSDEDGPLFEGRAQPLRAYVVAVWLALSVSFQVSARLRQGPGPVLHGPRVMCAHHSLIVENWRGPSPVEVHINNTRLMWSLAPELNVLVIFAGHRYESESFPDLVGLSDCIRHYTSPARARPCYCIMQSSSIRILDDYWFHSLMPVH